jgi:hypothetical protein
VEKMEPTSKAGIPTVTGKVTSILIKSTNKAVLKAQWLKYFVKPTDTSKEHKNQEKEEKYDTDPKDESLEPIKTITNQINVLKGPVHITIKNFECCNAYPTSQNNEVSDDTTAKKQSIAEKINDKDKLKNNGEIEIVNDFTKNPHKHCKNNVAEENPTKQEQTGSNIIDEESKRTQRNKNKQDRILSTKNHC